MKGQASFESLFIMMIVISSAIYVTSLYMQTHENTLAIAITREELSMQANQKEIPIFVEKASVEIISNTPTVIVLTNPGTLTSADFDLVKVQDKIKASTNLDNIQIQIN